MSRSISRSARLNPLQEALLLCGSVLIAFAMFAYLQPEFLRGMGMSFTDMERMSMLVIGAACIALEQKTEKKIQEYAALVAGALGLVVGIANLMVYFDLIPDILGVVNAGSPLNGTLYLILGVWGVSAAVISEKHHR